MAAYLLIGRRLGSRLDVMAYTGVATLVGGVVLTATRLVNAIPSVVASDPGFLSALDLPLVTGRGLAAD